MKGVNAKLALKGLNENIAKGDVAKEKEAAAILKPHRGRRRSTQQRHG